MTQNEMMWHIMAHPHKRGVNIYDWEVVHPNLIPLAMAYVQFCGANQIPVMFTSIIRQNIPGISISKTHLEGRAFDASYAGWTKIKEERFLQLNANFEGLAAISRATGKPTAFQFHGGTAYHLHAQVRA